jgi:hypothetical protein
MVRSLSTIVDGAPIIEPASALICQNVRSPRLFGGRCARPSTAGSGFGVGQSRSPCNTIGRADARA